MLHLIHKAYAVGRVWVVCLSCTIHTSCVKSSIVGFCIEIAQNLLHWNFLQRLIILTSDNDGGGISSQRAQTLRANNDNSSGSDVYSCTNSSQEESEYDDDTVIYATSFDDDDEESEFDDSEESKEFYDDREDIVDDSEIEEGWGATKRKWRIGAIIKISQIICLLFPLGCYC